MGAPSDLLLAQLIWRAIGGLGSQGGRCGGHCGSRGIADAIPEDHANSRLEVSLSPLPPIIFYFFRNFFGAGKTFTRFLSARDCDKGSTRRGEDCIIRYRSCICLENTWLQPLEDSRVGFNAPAYPDGSASAVRWWQRAAAAIPERVLSSHRL